MDFTLKQLAAFVAISESGSFSKSAAALNMTAPAISVAIRSLEDRAGFKMFDRTTRSVKLTQAGQTLLPHVERLLSEYDSIKLILDNIRRKQVGLVRVVAPQLFNCIVLPSIYTRLEEMHPDIEVMTIDIYPEKLEEALQNGAADIGIGPERSYSSEIAVVPLFTYRLAVTCSRQHPFATRESVAWRELEGQMVISAERNIRSVIARDSQLQILSPRNIQVQHFTTALALAAENRGIVVGPASIGNLGKAFDVALIPLVEPIVHRPVALYYNLRHTMSPATELLSEKLKMLLSAYGDSGFAPL